MPLQDIRSDDVSEGQARLSGNAILLSELIPILSVCGQGPIQKQPLGGRVMVSPDQRRSRALLDRGGHGTVLCSSPPNGDPSDHRTTERSPAVLVRSRGDGRAEAAAVRRQVLPSRYWVLLHPPVAETNTEQLYSFVQRGDGGDEDSRAQPSSVGQNPESSMARRWDHPMTERTPVTNGYIDG